MSDAFVQVQLDQTGKKVQTFENIVGGAIVEAQATVAVNPATGVAITPALEGGGLATTLASIDAKVPPLGQAQMSASVPVALANDQNNFYARYDRRLLEAQAQSAIQAQGDAMVTRYAEKRSFIDGHGRIGRGVR